MKKLHIFVSALVALVALSVAMVSSASASELLANSNTISSGENLTAKLEGELLLESLASGVDLECKGSFDLLIENGTLAFITDVLPVGGVLVEYKEAENLAKQLVSGDNVDCTPKSTCANPTLVVAINLPWHVELELINNEYKMHILNGTEEAGKEPAWWVDCETTLFGLVAELCEGLTLATLTEPSVGDVEAAFNTEEPECENSLGQKGKGLVVGKSLLEDTSQTGVTFSLS